MKCLFLTMTSSNPQAELPNFQFFLAQGIRKERRRQASKKFRIWPFAYYVDRRLRASNGHGAIRHLLAKRRKSALLSPSASAHELAHKPDSDLGPVRSTAKKPMQVVHTVTFASKVPLSLSIRF